MELTMLHSPLNRVIFSVRIAIVFSLLLSTIAAPSATARSSSFISGNESRFEGSLLLPEANQTIQVTGDIVYISAAGKGTTGGVVFDDEDILAFDKAASTWSMYFDGSDVGLSKTDVDAFDLQPDGSILVSIDSAPFTLTGLGAIDDSDILKFSPTSTGSSTAGSYSWYFDGSDVGLDKNDEDIDAISFAPDGRLVISTLGNVAVTGV